MRNKNSTRSSKRNAANTGERAATYRWEGEVEAKAGEPGPEDDVVGVDGRRAEGSWSTTDLERGFAEAIRSAMDYAMRQDSSSSADGWAGRYCDVISSVGMATGHDAGAG
ncbi:uncharacterized protein ColSpa_06710 [Colletotrichum spaethianum]|uniref:Uncharacterized protein n=1 Tax=Colletotrichum spaethianum TaxID=700344 RepID=A0AA37LHT0_9PEZI|nr:uncharacterized protein ColSpa_06710 [Colletotrichum spaethianum]GKT46529.1 hypothetical protein ColSpa_06710 [Colletotrichum spaethianum]